MFVCSLLGLAACVFLLFALSHSPPTIYDLAVDLSCCDLNNPNCAQGVPVALSMGTTGELTFLNGVQCIAAPSPAPCSSSPTQSGYVIAPGNSTSGSTRAVSCSNGYSGTATDITCTDGVWSASSGCSLDSIDCTAFLVSTVSGPDSNCGASGESLHTWPINLGPSDCHGWSGYDNVGDLHWNSANNIRS